MKFSRRQLLKTGVITIVGAGIPDPFTKAIADELTSYKLGDIKVEYEGLLPVYDEHYYECHTWHLTLVTSSGRVLGSRVEIDKNLLDLVPGEIHKFLAAELLPHKEGMLEFLKEERG